MKHLLILLKTPLLLKAYRPSRWLQVLLCLLLLPCTYAKAQQADLDNITDPRQRINYIKRHSKQYFFREGRYGDAIAPRDTAVLVAYMGFLIDINERRAQNKMDGISQDDIKKAVTELDVNYGAYSRIMIFCERERVLPLESHNTNVPPPPPPPSQTGGTATTAPDQSNIDPPLPPDVLQTLFDIDSYRDFTSLLMELKNEGKISVVGMASTEKDLHENYLAIFSRETNKLLALWEPLKDNTYRNLVTGKIEKLEQYDKDGRTPKRIYFR